ELEHEAVTLPILRDVPEPIVEVSPDRVARDVTTGELDASRFRPLQAREGVDELRLPVPVDAREPDDLAGVCFERDAANLLDPARSEEHTSELQSRFDLVCR